MNVVYAPEDSFIGRIVKNLKENEGKHPIAIDLTEEEYREMLKEAGAPPGAHLPQVLGIMVTVDGRPAEQVGAGLVVPNR